MTDTELSRIEAICETANVKDIGDVSDGYHTFNGLYYQRMILFAALVKAYRDKAWKSHRHEDGELCFGGGWFIVGIDTPEGSFTYHYEDKDWDRFDCQELPVAKYWDGHREENVTRLLSLPIVIMASEDKPRWIPVTERLPEPFENILVANKRGKHYDIDKGWWNGTFFDRCAKGGYHNVTHWMPLPEPPKEAPDA